MKIEQSKVVFQPVVLTLESKEELNILIDAAHEAFYYAPDSRRAAVFRDLRDKLKAIK